MISVIAVINRHMPGEWEGAHPLPTFYLDERVSGIISLEQAEKIARSIILPFGEMPEMSASINVVRVEGDDNHPMKEWTHQIK